MKRLNSVVFALLLFGILVLTGCTDPADTGDINNNEESKLSVVTTIFPPYDFVREIAGDRVELTLLLSPGAESHSFEPTPRDMNTIQNADVFIYTGGESDYWIEQILESMDTEVREGITLIPMMELVETYEEEIVEGMEGEDDHDDDGEDEDDGDRGDGTDDSDDEEVEYDEHVWTSPKNAMIIVERTADVLASLDEENADTYRANGEAYLEKLADLDQAFAEVTAGAVRNTIVFGDRYPFRYLSEAYGLKYFAAFPGCSTETEPSPATVAFLIDKVIDEEIPVIFHIEFSNEKMADAICESTGAKKLQLHSCHNLSREDMKAGVTYLDLMYQNVENLKEALY